jgi:hypothetical protein
MCFVIDLPLGFSGQVLGFSCEFVCHDLFLNELRLGSGSSSLKLGGERQCAAVRIYVITILRGVKVSPVEPNRYG